MRAPVFRLQQRCRDIGSRCKLQIGENKYVAQSLGWRGQQLPLSDASLNVWYYFLLILLLYFYLQPYRLEFNSSSPSLSQLICWAKLLLTKFLHVLKGRETSWSKHWLAQDLHWFIPEYEGQNWLLGKVKLAVPTVLPAPVLLWGISVANVHA